MLRKIILSSVLLALAYPCFNIWPCAFFAFVPFFFAIEKTKLSKAFLFSWLFGFAFFLITIFWLIHVTLPGMIMVAAYLALYFAVFGLLCNYSMGASLPNAEPRRIAWQYLMLIFIPAYWVSAEWLRSHLMTGFPWALLAHSQAFNLPVIQIADIFGAYGVSFVIMLVNVAIFITIKEFREKEFRMFALAIASVVVFFVLSYGIFRMKNVFIGESYKVCVVQGNIPQYQKWDANFREMIISRYETLTADAAKNKCDLIIWPETSVPGFLEEERDLLNRVRDLAVRTKTPLLVGSPRDDRSGGERYYNSVYLISGDGMIVDIYDKIHLVPFGEYLPLKGVFAFVEKFAKNPIGDFRPGEKYTVFKLTAEKSIMGRSESWRMIKKVKFSSLICFEDIFPEISRRFVKDGALFLVNMTNDAWFNVSAAPYQHAQCSIFRAVENRINVIRAANTGLSCFIDQKGRITDRVSRSGKDIFIDGHIMRDITLTKTRTWYNVHGDLIVYFCIAMTISALIWKSIRR